MSDDKRTPIFDHSVELLKNADEEIYKSIGEVKLPLYIFRPTPSKPGADPLPAIIFFYSSLWDKGRVSQFAPQCIYFSQRGAVAIAAEYRVSDSDDTSAIDAMADARDAIRWIRLNAEELGVDPDKIVAAGGSAGGHLALAAAMIDDPAFAIPDEDLTLNHRPDALLLYGLVIDPGPLHSATSAFADLKTARLANAARYIRKDLPPMILFHGAADRILPISTAADFCRLMEKKKNKCTLIAYDSAGSGFFNFNVDAGLYEASLMASEDFLVDLGFLDAAEADEEFPSIEGRLTS